MELENEYSMPSRTDDPVEPVVQKPGARVDKERLSAGENDYLRSLEDKNRLLTIAVGDKVMEAEMAKASLKEHRESLRDAYISILKVHNVAEGRIDTRSGEVTVISRNS